MNTSAPAWVRPWIFSALALFSVSAVSAQQLYFVKKTQVFFQNSAAGSVPDLLQPFTFSAQAATQATLAVTSAGGSKVTLAPLAAVPSNKDFELNQSFLAKAALDAAFPNGTYQMTGNGIPTLSFNMGTDLYSAVNPSITGGGTWNSGGVLVVDPAQANTITFTTYSGYASTGTAGHMTAKIQGVNDNVNINTQIATQAVLGLTASSTPLTTIPIPAGTLTSGRVYQVEIDFDSLSTLDLTSVPGGGVIGLWGKALYCYIAAQAPGTTTPPPVIVSQMTNQTGVAGGSATFNLGVTVGGSSQAAALQNLVANFYFNGQQLSLDGTKYSFSSNGFGLRINNLTAADAGSYAVTLVNAGGIVVGNAATLTLVTAAAPTIATQPVSVTVNSGGTAVFSVAATGSPTPSYQWQRSSGAPGTGTSALIAGATSPTLVLSGVTGNNAALAGTYSVIVSNGVGSSVTSSPATLTVASGNDFGRLINLSVLTDIPAAGANFTVATVVGGAGTSGSKPLVMRVVGPSLAAITGSSAGLLPAPKLDLFLGSTAVATNSGWGGSAVLTTAMASVGAFAFTSPTSSDAAIFQTSLASGSYSVIASGVGGTTGLCLAEIYDATAAGTFTPSTPRLINVSVLKQISAGGSITLGFVVGGSSARTVLIRAIGPGLAAVGFSSGTLGDPQLTLFNGSNAVIASNDDWGADPQLSSVSSRVGAFTIGNSPSKDAMMIVTLPPGLYSARAAGNNGTSGFAIVEVYEVP